VPALQGPHFVTSGRSSSPRLAVQRLRPWLPWRVRRRGSCLSTTVALHFCDGDDAAQRTDRSGWMLQVGVFHSWPQCGAPVSDSEEGFRRVVSGLVQSRLLAVSLDPQEVQLGSRPVQEAPSTVSPCGFRGSFASSEPFEGTGLRRSVCPTYRDRRSPLTSTTSGACGCHRQRVGMAERPWCE